MKHQKPLITYSVTHTSKDNKFGVFGGFTFKSSLKVNENEQSTDNDAETLMLITDEDGDLDLSTVTTVYLAQNAEKETSYGAFVMAKGDVGDHIIGGGASLNKIDDKLMTQIITAGILDKDRNIALSLIRNDHTTFTPEGKDKSGRTNFKITFLPSKSNYEPKEADNVKLNDGVGITNLSKIHNDVEQGLHIDIES